MQGNNTLHLNKATMIEALNLWLASQFKEALVASNVTEKKDGHSTVFEVVVAPSEAAE